MSPASEAFRDTLAVEDFAKAMEDKLAVSRAKGRHGWHDVPVEDLWQQLHRHAETGDIMEIALACMMLHHNSKKAHS